MQTRLTDGELLLVVVAILGPHTPAQHHIYRRSVDPQHIKSAVLQALVNSMPPVENASIA